MTRLCRLLVLIVLAAAPVAAAQRADIAPLYDEVVHTGWLRVPGVGFGPGSSRITPGSAPALERVLALLREHTEWTFEVQVHLAPGGSAEADQRLSDARAEALARWWREHGIDARRLVPRGYGRSRPPHAGEAPDRVELRKLNEE